MAEKLVRSHEFWLETCGRDTYKRGSNFARIDTPWNGFTNDDESLVCTLWVDTIAEIFDAEENRIRKFVRLGGKSREWKGLAVSHGEDARNNLERAIRLRKPVFGYEAEPQAGALDRGERKVKHFYLNRVHQLHGWIGLRKADLEERLNIEAEFKRRGITNDSDVNAPATLFELVATTARLPGVSESQDAVDPEIDGDAADDEADDSGGNLSADQYARLALPMLVAHVLKQQDDVLEPITYFRLAEMLGRRNKHGDPFPRGLGHVLVRVTALIEQTASQLPEQPPFLTTIIVQSGTGLPGTEVSDQWPGYESLPRDDKAAKVLTEYHRILEFGSRWNEVLRLLDLLPVEPTSGSVERRGGSGGWAGGESEAHKALKQFILEHSEVCGVPEECWLRESEFALRSGDAIDVMFKAELIWVGVEVKSRVSDGNPDDYERGLYQAVKYKAVLEAQARIDYPDNPPEVHVFLALENELPADRRELAAALGVRYLERVLHHDPRATVAGAEGYAQA